MLADLAVAPIPAAALGGKVVEARPELGLPPLPSYSLCMFVAPQAAAFVRAAADHLRAGFTSYGS